MSIQPSYPKKSISLGEPMGPFYQRLSRMYRGLYGDMGRIVEYHRGVLQRNHKLPSDTLLYHLQYRLRCSACNRRGEFRIALVNHRERGGGLSPSGGLAGTIL